MRPKSRDGYTTIKIGKGPYRYLRERQNQINASNPIPPWTLRNVLDQIITDYQAQQQLKKTPVIPEKKS